MARSNKSSAYMVQRKLVIQGVWIRSQQGFYPFASEKQPSFRNICLIQTSAMRPPFRLAPRRQRAIERARSLPKTPVPLLTEEVVERCLGRFRGEIHQTPSMYSAIKKDGQPLYKLARQGIEVEREARPVTIFELVLRGMGPETLDLEVHCSKGTYIRSLAEDIGTELGCGAHVAELRRTGVGQFSIEDAVSMDTVVERSDDGPEGMDPLLLPIQEAVVNLPRVELSEHTGAYLLQGQPVQVSSAPKAGLVQLFHSLGTEERFIGIGEVLDDGKIAPRRLIAAQ